MRSSSAAVGDERQVDRQDEDGLGATRDDVVPSLAEPGIQAAVPLAEAPGAELGRAARRTVAIRADDQDVRRSARPASAAPTRPCQQPLDEIVALLGVERSRRGGSWRLRASATGMIAAIRMGVGSGRHRRASDPRANAMTSAASRARPASSAMIVSVTSVAQPEGGDRRASVGVHRRPGRTLDVRGESAATPRALDS